MTRRAWILTVGLAVVAVAVAAAVLLTRGPGQGPLSPPTDDIGFTSVRRDIGQRVTMPVADLGSYHGDQPAVLDSIVPNSTLVGLRMVGSGVTSGVGTLDGYPPDGHHLQALRGFRVTPSTGPVQVVVGLQLTSSGDHHIDGFTLHYHVGSTHYTAVFHQGVTFCATGSMGC